MESTSATAVCHYLIQDCACIVGPLGDVLVEPNFDGKLDQLAELGRGKYDCGNGGSYSRPDVFRLHVDEQAQSAVVLSGGGPDV
jgi:nitrilase